ncbi:MAG TPA: DUF3015 domain-containing protein [Aeromonadales bacterium]|nr:DUF3015 domain-containing protein [Aeromonadales bacterium]
MKKFNTLILAAVTLFSLGSATVFAKGQPGSGPSPYTDCGIGAALFKDTHWAAISSNVIWDLGSTALTSATASPETCSGNKVVAAEFINRTYDNLIEETAQGSGQHITAMLNIFGCNSNVQPAIISEARTQVSKELSSDNYSTKTRIQKAESFYFNINSLVDGKYSQSCSA